MILFFMYKNEEKIRKIFFPYTDQNQFCSFWENKKNTKQILISNFLLGQLFFYASIRGGFCKFSPTNINF